MIVFILMSSLFVMWFMVCICVGCCSVWFSWCENSVIDVMLFVNSSVNVVVSSRY